jgi:hypothetical protein
VFAKESAVNADPVTNVLGSLRQVAPRRAALGALIGSATAALLAPRQRDALAKKRQRNPCHGKNWCLDRTQTCGPVGGQSKCFVKAFGGNVCGEIFLQVASCDACDPPNCRDCQCVLAAGGGDHCTNGLGSHNDFFCVIV